MSTLMFKTIHGMAPKYLCDQINLVQDVSDRVTRNSEQLNVFIPMSKLSKHEESFSITGGKIWNALPQYLKEYIHLCSYKKNYKQWFWGPT